jgi:hypothetical protein
LRDVATDPSGNVVVTGIDSGIRGFITIKYSGQGTALWTNTLVQGLGSGGEPEPMALAVGPTGDVYVTGKSTDHGAVTRKCSAAGSTLWTTHYKSPNLDTVYDYGAVALAVVANGDAYIAARSAPETPDDTGDYAIIKYSSGGTALWTNIYHRSDYDYPSDLAVDASGNVWVTGTTYSDYGTVAYSSAGIPLCTNIYDFGIDVASSLATDSVGNIYVTGYSRDDSGDYDFATIKYAGATATSIPLQIQSLGNQVILSWTNPAFDLQAAPTVTGAFTNISGATSPYTNSIANSQRFFRLRAN